jgi:hypothetical protein
MVPGMVLREWSVTEQHRQDLLREAANLRVLRSVQCDLPPASRISVRGTLGAAIEKLLRALGAVTSRPPVVGPRGFRDGLM